MNTKRNVNKRLINKLESAAKERLSFGSLIKSIRFGEEMTQESFASLTGYQSSIYVIANDTRMELLTQIL